MSAKQIESELDRQGLYNGDRFTSEAQVREMFTPTAQRAMWGEQADLTQPQLDEIAEYIIQRRLHCEF